MITKNGPKAKNVIIQNESSLYNTLEERVGGVGVARSVSGSRLTCICRGKSGGRSTRQRLGWQGRVGGRESVTRARSSLTIKSLVLGNLQDFT